MLVDSHCHLDLACRGGDPGHLVEAALRQGVSHLLTVSVDLTSFPRLLDYADAYPAVSASVGVHPNTRREAEPDVGQLAALAADPRVVAVGETGLDYFRSSGDLEWQRERFRRHIAAARLAGKPLIIHSRDAGADVLRILEEEAAGEIGGVMHCFSEDWDTAARVLDLGFLISFSGIVTFKSARALKQVAVRVPLDRFLVETDAPYLAPVPHRGKPNQPAYVRYVAEHIATLRGTTVEAVADASSGNFFRVFQAAKP